MAQKIGERELALKAMTERNAGAKSTKAPQVGKTRPVKAWRDMNDAERAEYMRDPQGIEARRQREAAEDAAPGPLQRRAEKALRTMTAEDRDKIAELRQKILADETSSKPNPAPAKASAPDQEKPTMAKKAKKAAKKKAAKKAPVKRKPAAKTEGGDNKTAQLLTMLQSPKGCTAAEACAALGWEQISIPPVAKRAGLKLRKEKEGRGIRYFATAA